MGSASILFLVTLSFFCLLDLEGPKTNAVLTVHKAVANLVGVNKKATEDVEPFKSFYVGSLPHCLRICQVHGCQSFNLHIPNNNQCVIYTRPVCGENGYDLQDGDVGQNHYTVKIITQSKNSEVESLEWVDSCWPRNAESDETTSAKSTTASDQADSTSSDPTTTEETTSTTTLATTSTTLPPTTTTTQLTTSTTLPSTTTTAQTTTMATTTEGLCTEGIRIEKLCFILLTEITYNEFTSICLQNDAKVTIFPDDTGCRHFSNVVKNLHPEFPTFFIGAQYVTLPVPGWELTTRQPISAWGLCWNGKPIHQLGKDCVGMKPPEFTLVELDCNVKTPAMCFYKLD